MKRTIEIDDTLEDDVQSVLNEMIEDFIEWLEENDTEDFDNYYQSSGCDKASESADSNTPIYNSDIDGIYYLYGDELEEAYKDAGIGKGGEDNHQQIAICCYLEQKAHDFLNSLKDIYDDWRIEYNKIEVTDKELVECKLRSPAQEQSVKDFIEQVKELKED